MLWVLVDLRLLYVSINSTNESVRHRATSFTWNWSIADGPDSLLLLTLYRTGHFLGRQSHY